MIEMHYIYSYSSKCCAARDVLSTNCQKVYLKVHQMNLIMGKKSSLRIFGYQLRQNDLYCIYCKAVYMLENYVFVNY